jgi:predicted extracellular nuclease
MRRIALLAVVSLLASLLPLTTALAQAPAPSGAVVISQVYGGGGNSGATLTHDYVELFNRGDAPASLDGLSVQYASSTGTGNFGANAGQLVALSGTVPAGGYHLVQLAGGTTGAPLPAADNTGTINLSGTAGKVALAEGTGSLGCNGGSTPCTQEQLDRIVDLVGYGNANFYEGSGAAPTLSNTTAGFRADDGCTDTDDNAADFTAATPAPRNSASPTNLCGGGGGPSNAPVTTACTDLSLVAGDGGSVTLTASDEDGTVTDATITGGATDGIDLDDLQPATTVGDTLYVDLVVDSTVGSGTYPVDVRFSNDDATPQSATCRVTVTVDATCAAPTLISDINTVGGNGLPATDRLGDRLAVEAIVTADFKSGLNGFYVQEEEADYDDDVTTSEGIFAYAPALASAPEVGTLVCVLGTVAIFSGQVQLTNIEVETIAPDQPLPAAIELVLPVDDRVEIAQIAGMRVELTGQDGTLTIAQNYFQGQYGELDLSGSGRLWNPTELYDPEDPAAAALRDFNQRSQIKLDDASSQQNPTPMPWLANGAARAGAVTDDVVEGIAGYQHGSYRVQPTDPAAIEFTNTDNPRPEDAPDVLGAARRYTENVTVAAFNVLNYFTTLTSESGAARGADTVEEFELQAAKIVTAITKMDADVVGLMEIENNFGEDGDALADLVDRLNAVAGPGTYAGVALEAPVGSDAISNAMIYQPAVVTPVGDLAVADHPAFVNPLGANIDRNRPALAQAFETETGDVFIAVVNHLKSKGSSCGAADSAGGLAGNCNLTRTMAAEELVRWLEEDDPTGTGSDLIAVIGDLNAYAQEDPIDVLWAAGYVDALADQLGSAYSYVFDGELGRLDHAFLSSSLNEHLVGAAEWHINADEPNGFDYNDWNDPATQDTSEFRSSDHDPVIVGLAFVPERPYKTDHCKEGGWRLYEDPSFRNQGACVSWVATDGR